MYYTWLTCVAVVCASFVAAEPTANGVITFSVNSHRANLTDDSDRTTSVEHRNFSLTTGETVSVGSVGQVNNTQPTANINGTDIVNHANSTQVIGNRDDIESVRDRNGTASERDKAPESHINKTRTDRQQFELRDDDAGIRSNLSIEDEIPGKKNLRADVSQRKKLLLGSFTTISHTVVSFLTSTVPHTCVQGVVTGTICNGRKRRFRKINIDMSEDVNLPELSPSSEHPSPSDDDEVKLSTSPNRQGKAFYTVWVRNTVRTTLTTYSTNTATTVSLSYFCSAGGLTIPATACG